MFSLYLQFYQVQSDLSMDFCLSVLKEIFKHIAPDSRLISCAFAGVIATDYNRIFANNSYIFPAYFYIIISAHKSEASAFAPYYHRYETPTAGVYLHIAYAPESATRI